jgi:hypothetical protein
MMMREAVPMSIANMLTQEMMLTAWVDFFALKYLHENLKRILPFMNYVLR